MSLPRIVTHYWAKPIPLRQFDWQAYYDGDEPNDNGSMPHGEGRTEAQAVVDLIENHPRYPVECEREPDCEHQEVEYDRPALMCSCLLCGESWPVAVEDIDDHERILREAAKFGRRAARRERWLKLTFPFRWWLQGLLRRWRMKRAANACIVDDDDIPF